MSALISNQVLQLASADSRWLAEVSPVGASLVSLWFDGIEIVTSPFHQACYAVAGAVMAPWPNRLEDGTWQMGERKFAAPINDEQGHNANHGLVLDKEFEIVEQSDTRIRLETNLFDAAAYPFEVSLSVTYELTDGGLQIGLETKNIDTALAPVAFGLHPYFVCDEDSQVELQANVCITKDARNLPLKSVAIEESKAAKRGLNLVRELDIDDCFTDLISESEGSVTRLTRPGHGLTVAVVQSKELNHLMLYKFTEDKMSKRTLLAIEPQSAPANAFRSLEQVKILTPKESFRATCKITQRKNP